MVLATERAVSPEQEVDKATGLMLDGVMVVLHIPFWRGRQALTAQDLGVDPGEVPDIFSLGSKMVVPKEALARFERIRAKADFIITQFTFPFPTGSARFVPYTVWPEVMAELNGLKYRFRQETAEFIEKYDEYRQQMADKYPQHADAIKRAAIPANQIHSKFGFDYTLYSIQMPRAVRYKAMEAREALNESEARRKAMERAEAQYREQFDAQMDEFLSNSVGKLREAVAQALGNVSSRMEKGDLVTQNSLTAVKRAIQRFRDLNFVQDAEVEARLRELDEMVPEKSESLKNTDVQARFQAAIAAAMGSIVGSDINEVTGEYKRKLRM
ncbi:MAG: DUF3150 domain-containing protein [Dehalococcoidia bacterium]|nr:DUF3150 domain-containing protein [Dehalococcoidia bacterium]